MENFEDPIQKNLREKLKESGTEFSQENKNRFLTKEEIEDRKNKNKNDK